MPYFPQKRLKNSLFTLETRNYIEALVIYMRECDDDFKMALMLILNQALKSSKNKPISCEHKHESTQPCCEDRFSEHLGC